MLWILNVIMTSALAAPPALTYQGRIVKSDGQPLQAASVSFQFEITSSDGACVLYREQVNGINMQNSGGVFDIAIGNSHSYPGSPSFTILDSFNNSGPLICDGGAPFSPTLQAGRLLRVQFHDGSSWKLITPDAVIRSVPFAGYSESAAKLGGNLPSDFVLKSGINSNTNCDSGSFLTWDATTRQFGCDVAPAGGGGGSGTVTNVTSANSYLTVTNGTTTPQLTVHVGTVANTVAAGNDSRFTDSRTPNGSASGDLSGTYPGPTVAKIQGTSVSATAPAAAGQVLRYNGTTAWAAGFLSLADIRSSVTPANTMFPATSCTAAETLTWSSLTDTMSCTTIGLAGSQITSGTVAVARLGTGTADNTKYLRGDGTWQTLSVTETDPKVGTNSTNYLSKWNGTALVNSAVYENSGNLGIGTTSPARLIHVRSNSSTVNPGVIVESTDTGGRSYSFGTTMSTSTAGVGKFVIADETAAVARVTVDSTGRVGIGTTTPGSLLEVAGQVKITGGAPGANKVLTSDASGLASWQSLPSASNVDLTSAVTGVLPIANGGTNSSTTLNNNRLMASVGGAIQEMGAMADGQVVVGKNSSAPQIVTLGGDATISNTGSLTIATGAVTTGKILDGTIAAADLNFAGTMTTNTGLIVRDGTQFYNKTCSGNEALIWSVSNGWICSAITLTESDPKIGSNTTDYLSKWNGTALVASAVYENSSNVGIGTASPQAALHVAGTANETLRVESNNNIGTGINLINSTTGAHTYQFFTTGAGNGSGAGLFGVFDSTANMGPLAINGLASKINTNASGQFGWSSSAQFADGGNDTAIGRSAAGVVEITNGSAGTLRDLNLRALNPSSGNVGIGTTSPSQKLHVAGNIKASGQVASGSQTITSSATSTIDWNNGNAISTNYNCASNLTMDNLSDGGTFTLVITDTGTTQCNFSTTTTGTDAGTVSYRFKPSNDVRDASTHTIYTLMRVGSVVYVSWGSGF